VRRLAILVGWLGVACTAPQTVLVTPPPPTATPVIHGTLPISTAAPASTFDRQVIDMLVPHHEASIEMARIALARSQRADVKAFAEEVERVQTQEVKDMRAWREMWFGARDTPSMSQMPVLLEPGAPVASGTVLTVDLGAEVEALRNAPEPFDATFVDAMERHQQRPIEAAMLALRRARQQELLDLSGSILESHQRWARQLSDLR
jgi:uncharacterized protein (DUF305 family)